MTFSWILFLYLQLKPALPNTFLNEMNISFVYIPVDNHASASLKKGVWVSKYEVTQQVWENVMGFNPSLQKGASHPVENVSWNEIQTFLAKLNQLDSAKQYRLPYSWEWQLFSDIEETPLLDYVRRHEWTRLNSGKRHHPVGSLPPNRYGICDTLGNVMEWCQETYSSCAKERSLKIADKAAGWKVYTGGHFHGDPNLCQSRLGFDADYKSIFLGFRLVCEEK